MFKHIAETNSTNIRIACQANGQCRVVPADSKGQVLPRH